MAKNDIEADCVAVEAGEYMCTPDVTSPDFVEYNDLTEAAVLSWVKDALNEGGDTVSDIETRLTDKVDTQLIRKATQANGLPWVRPNSG